MKKYFIIANCCFILFGCKNDKKKENTFPGKTASVNAKNIITKIDGNPMQITIDLSKTIEGNFDDYFSLKKVIYIDGKSPIGQISLIRQYKEKLFILDRENTQQLYCFDLEGKLIWEFKSRGRGPLEYNQIYDFIINEKKGTIDVLDSGNNKIINIDINTGIAKKEFKLGFFGREMVLYNNGDYLLYTGNITVNNDLNYKLLLANTNQEVKSRCLPILEGEKNKYSAGFRSLDQSNETIYFTETFNDTIYTIKNDELKTAFYVEFLDKKYPQELMINFTQDKADRLNRAKPYINNIDRVSEKNGILNFMFSYNKSFYTVFYDIRNKSTYIFNMLKSGKKLDVFEQIIFQGNINEGYVKIVEPFYFDKLRKDFESNKKFRDNIMENNPKMYNIISKTNENSNPILFIYEFKKRN